MPTITGNISSSSVSLSGDVNVKATEWGLIGGTLSNQEDLQDALDDKQDEITSSNKLSASLVSGLATVATSGSYQDLSNQPTIGDATISIKKNGSLVQSFTTNQTSDQDIDIVVPTKTSDLTNDSGFIDKDVDDLTNYYDKDATDDLLDDKANADDVYTKTESDNKYVAQVSGKGLSTNDYTNADKSKVDSSLQPNDNISELTNDSGYITSSYHDSTKADASDVYTKTESDTLLNAKVDKITGKGLSEEDFTSTLKTKLDGIESGAEVNDIDDVQVNGTSVVANKIALIPIASEQTDGVMSASDKTKLNGVSSNAKNVSVSATGTATDEIQYITIDGTEKKIAGESFTILTTSEVDTIWEDN